MIQYLDLLKKIKSSGTYKPAARANMPGTQSYFGYQFRHDLADGFPLLTTKKMYWKGVYQELLWFLKGDTNIKYLVDRGVNIWNEDAYQFYLKKIGKDANGNYRLEPMTFETFVERVKDNKNYEKSRIEIDGGYKLGDCGYQYGRVWRKWERVDVTADGGAVENISFIDQIADIINGLRKNPESRRHIVNAWDVAHANDLALTWCHAMFQFNCRPLTQSQRIDNYMSHDWADPFDFGVGQGENTEHVNKILDESGIPKYYLDCQLYQRSADVVLGVPFNIASYALLTHILAKMANMVPGDFIHTFGDVHIYDNHVEAVEEQLTRTPDTLPTLDISACPNVDWATADLDTILNSINGFEETTFAIKNYNPQGAIKAKLSTGLK